MLGRGRLHLFYYSYCLKAYKLRRRCVYHRIGRLDLRSVVVTYTSPYVLSWSLSENRLVVVWLIVEMPSHVPHYFVFRRYLYLSPCKLENPCNFLPQPN
jgi:hypothetical protein